MSVAPPSQREYSVDQRDDFFDVPGFAVGTARTFRHGRREYLDIEQMHRTIC
jgi:hypothetical protein